MAKQLEPPLLSVEQLSVSIAGKTILSEVTLSVNTNEILALVGESGSGKSVTAQSIMGLLSPKKTRIDQGNILFNRQALPPQNSPEWQTIRGEEISMIFQEPQSSLNPTMRCGVQVAEMGKQHRPQWSKKEVKAKVISAFEAVKLPDPEQAFKSYPHQLSGGQKQRVMIAMALLCEPKLLIADEPTTALDVLVQQDIIQLIKELQKKNKMSVLFISHDLSLVVQMADRIAVMKQGRIVEENTTQTLLTKPQHPYTKGLLAARPKTNRRLEQLPTLEDINEGNFTPQFIADKTRKELHQKIYGQEAILKVDHLVKTYHKTSLFGGTMLKTNVVKDISFSLYSGETLGLVGASGCGKSTLARALIFLDPPTQGSITWQGETIDPKNKKHIQILRKDIQFVFQDPYAALHPLKRIGSAIEEVLAKHHKKSNSSHKTRALDLLNQVGLSEEFYSRYPHELSGGQRQRVVIARALAVEPKVLLCDESVAALDISVQATVLNLLNHLKNTLQLSYLFISHDLAIVKHMADRIMVMHQGEIVEENEADELYNHPKTPYTKELLKAVL